MEECRALKNSLQDHEAVVQMDFSENYACKLNVEVQHYHWRVVENRTLSLPAWFILQKGHKLMPQFLTPYDMTSGQYGHYNCALHE